MKICKLSQKYQVKQLTSEDVDAIFALCRTNPMFYQYHPPFVTKESIRGNHSPALPPKKDRKDKYYIGFYKENQLIAVMDLILDYPQQGIAFIGFFMVDQAYQKHGIGSEIIQGCIQYLNTCSYQKIRLAIDQGNSQSEAFWTKNHFVKTGEECKHECGVYLPMEFIQE